uniref:UDP-glucose:glycoprotein glucosyltransferase 1-like n=1 Tax=Styela clava TaxID=7725 RepID=UPI001939E03A|nr:UDP-glucose:glycoprotein glucosyltransferase 1-like [Styela clava]
MEIIPIFCITLISTFQVIEGKSKPIIASLNAKWKFTPLALEASEFMAEEGEHYFWKFVDEMVSTDSEIQAELTQRKLYEWSIEGANNVLGTTADSQRIKLLKFALSLRTYSPKIEMFNQLALDAPAPTCDEFFEVRGQVTCSWTEMKKAIENKKGDSPILYKQDHIYPGSQASFNDTVILYANFMSLTMPDLHDRLAKMAEKHQIQYVLRHWIRARPEGPVKLSGYGVELALKKTEYKAVDDSEVKDDSGKPVNEEEQDEEIEGFDFKKLRKLHPDLSPQLTDFRNHLQESTNEMMPMKAWQLQDLSFQAAARVLSSPPQEQLHVLKDISQNFPLRARSLTKQKVPDELRQEIQKNQKHSFSNGELMESGHILLINGIPFDLETTDIYTLFDILRSESKIMDGLTYFNIKEQQMKSFLYLDIKSKTDSHYLDIRDPAVIWLNDIEKDKKYKHWPTNLHELLRPAFPGTLRRLKKNWCHLVFVVDPLNPQMEHLITTAEALWANDIPIKFGFVFIVNDEKEVDGLTDAGVGLIRAYNFAKSELSGDEAFTFLAGIYKSLKDDKKLTSDHIVEKMKKKFPGEDLELILGVKSDYDEDRRSGKSFYRSSGLTGDVNVLMNGELLSSSELNEENFEDIVIERVFEATRYLQRAIYMGEVSGTANLLDFFMQRPEVVPRFNDIILKDEPKFINFQGKAVAEPEYWDKKKFRDLSNTEQTATVTKYLKKSYLAKSDSTTIIRPVTMWIVTDVETKHGRLLVQNALKHIKSSGLSRVGIIYNPSNKENGDGFFVRAIEATLATQQNNNARNFILKITKEENAEALASGTKKLPDFYVGGMDEDRFDKLFQQSPKVLLPHIASQSIFCKNVLNLKKGESAVVANGRIISLPDPEVEFVTADFKLLETVLLSSATQMIKENLEKEGLTMSDTAEDSDLIMKLTSLLSTQPPLESERRSLQVAGSQHSVIQMESRDESIPAFSIVAVLDPASESAQQISALISVLYDVINTQVKIYMNCQEKLSDMPVKRFYRYVLDTEPKFKMSNYLYDGPLAKFSDMPRKTLLTMTIFPPEGWMVAAVKAVYDLDNIKLEEVSSASVTAEYELEHLLLEGHCSDVMTGSRPGGLQFTLGTKSNPLLVDTIVMANLGYFQLKANPGAWFLRLREGKSQDIYDITGHSRTDSPPGNNNITVLMDSFKSRVIMVKVSKKPEKLDEDLLDDDKDSKKEGSPGIWDSIANTLTGGTTGGGTAFQGSEDVLNIFSLASGHLYERLMRIMIVSVLRTTKAKVKFWMLKNYLSPHFKNFIPKMAEKYGFEYELVQYKWPNWLNQQKEKQRTMWGYKILFLDVLFPLDVDKIIFVDADQIVRADLRELRDLDLEGNPYGYTPFCDDRKEMDGFRFWKQGYWRQHLAGRKYHISAIYVVDLKKFRRIAAGDRLRGQYQGLSQDPNSLSNLDQDLPNNMIHQVGIKSLPQEWLWCETWCSDASKPAAKTIDLCNNPKTKESKLTAAVRIVPEWTEYDNEIKTLQKELEDTSNQTSETHSSAGNKHIDKNDKKQPSKEVHGEL